MNFLLLTEMNVFAINVPMTLIKVKTNFIENILELILINNWRYGRQGFYVIPNGRLRNVYFYK